MNVNGYFIVESVIKRSNYISFREKHSATF